MLRPILRGTLAYVDFDVLEPFVAWHVPYISDEARKDFLKSYSRRLQHLSDKLFCRFSHDKLGQLPYIKDRCAYP